MLRSRTGAKVQTEREVQLKSKMHLTHLPPVGVTTPLTSIKPAGSDDFQVASSTDAQALALQAACGIIELAFCVWA
jgi:hypothetical protein